MGLLREIGMQPRQHQKSASAQIDFVIDFSLSGNESIMDRLPLPQTLRDPDRQGTSSKLALQNLPRRRISSGYLMSPSDDSAPENANGKSYRPAEASTESTIPQKTSYAVPDSPGTPPPLGASSIRMSLVSPPFTPASSQLDLANTLASPEPLKLPSQVATAKVRSGLDDQLPIVICESRARIPTTNGEEIFLHVYRNNVDTKEHLAIVFGQDLHSRTLFEKRPGETEHDRMTRGAYSGKLYPGRVSSGPEGEGPDVQNSKASPLPAPETNTDVLCRIHSECYTGETAWSARCDCGEQLDEAARLMSEAGRGVIVYLRQEGRGIGLGEKLKAYNLQDLGADTVQANLMLRHPADGRTFGLATAILLDLGLDRIRLMTNNPDKIIAVEGKQKEITVTQRVPMIPLSWQKKGGFASTEVDKYLETKITKMGHLLDR